MTKRFHPNKATKLIDPKRYGILQPKFLRMTYHMLTIMFIHVFVYNTRPYRLISVIYYIERK